MVNKNIGVGFESECESRAGSHYRRYKNEDFKRAQKEEESDNCRDKENIRSSSI